MYRKNYFSMALDWALQKIAQPAISQPPDQDHVGRKGRQATTRTYRASWANYFSRGGSTPSMRRRSPEEHSRRINAAIAKRERRCARNLRLAQGA
jgi:hypothetical protein